MICETLKRPLELGTFPRVEIGRVTITHILPKNNMRVTLTEDKGLWQALQLPTEKMVLVWFSFFSDVSLKHNVIINRYIKISLEVRLAFILYLRLLPLSCLIVYGTYK